VIKWEASSIGWTFLGRIIIKLSYNILLRVFGRNYGGSKNESNPTSIWNNTLSTRNQIKSSEFIEANQG
jgi:hypothetical protein